MDIDNAGFGVRFNLVGRPIISHQRDYHLYERIWADASHVTSEVVMYTRSILKSVQ